MLFSGISMVLHVISKLLNVICMLLDGIYMLFCVIRCYLYYYV